MTQQPGSANYAELIAGIREGDLNAISNFRNAFTPGIQFFLLRESNEINVVGRAEEIVLSLIEEITNGRITDSKLTSQIIESVRLNIKRQPLSHRPVDHDSSAKASQLAIALMKAIPDLEQKALKRYYVDLEAETEVCAKLHLTITQFRDSKLRLRTLFMDSLAKTNGNLSPIEVNIDIGMH